MSRIYGPEQRNRYSGPLAFIGEDIEAIVELANVSVAGVEDRVSALETTEVTTESAASRKVFVEVFT
jgi:hypothetical protein